MAPLKELLPPTQETKEEEDLDELKNEKEEEDFDEELEKEIETTQEKGMDSVLATDDQDNVYDKPTLSTLYRPKKDVDSDMYGGADEQLDKILKTQRFKPDKPFAGTSGKTGLRNTPVEFKEAEEPDPFGLDQFLAEVKKKAKKGHG